MVPTWTAPSKQSKSSAKNLARSDSGRNRVQGNAVGSLRTGPDHRIAEDAREHATRQLQDPILRHGASGHAEQQVLPVAAMEDHVTVFELANNPLGVAEEVREGRFCGGHLQMI